MLKHENSAALGRKAARQGFTLLELVVVLAILAALAGVAAGVFSNYQKRTHGSTSASSIRNVNQAIEAELITGGRIGGGLDSLVTAAGAVPDFVAESGSLSVQQPSADEIDALADLGIVSVYPAEASTDNATLEGHDYSTAPTGVPITTSSNLAAVDGASLTQVQNDFNLDPNNLPVRIYAFGLGEESELVGAGKTFREVPLHTPGEGSPITQYSRYILLVGVEGTVNTGGGSPVIEDAEAFYIGSVCIDDGENFNNANRNFEEYFEAAN